MCSQNKFQNADRVENGGNAWFPVGGVLKVSEGWAKSAAMSLVREQVGSW